MSSRSAYIPSLEIRYVYLNNIPLEEIISMFYIDRNPCVRIIIHCGGPSESTKCLTSEDP